MRKKSGKKIKKSVDCRLLHCCHEIGIGSVNILCHSLNEVTNFGRVWQQFTWLNEHRTVRLVCVRIFYSHTSNTKMLSIEINSIFMKRRNTRKKKHTATCCRSSVLKANRMECCVKYVGSSNVAFVMQTRSNRKPILEPNQECR